MEEPLWRSPYGGALMEEPLWRSPYGGALMEELDRKGCKLIRMQVPGIESLLQRWLEIAHVLKVFESLLRSLSSLILVCTASFTSSSAFFFDF